MVRFPIHLLFGLCSVMPCSFPCALSVWSRCQQPAQHPCLHRQPTSCVDVNRMAWLLSYKEVAMGQPPNALCGMRTDFRGKSDIQPRDKTLGSASFPTHRSGGSHLTESWVLDRAARAARPK